MKTIQKIIQHPTLLVLVDQAISSGSSFLITLVLAQKMDLTNFGLFSSLLLLTFLTMSISNALLIQPFQVTVAKVIQKKEYQVSLFLGLMVLLLFFMLSAKLLVLFLPKSLLDPVPIHAFLCFLCGYLINDFFRKLFLGIAKIKWVLWMDFLYLLLLSSLFIMPKLNLHAALFIIGIANLVSSLPGVLFLYQNYEKPVSWRFFLSNHVQQGKWLLTVALLQWASSNFFILVSGIYIGIEALGALRLVQTLFGVINIGLQTIENYFLPKISKLYLENVAQAKKYLINLTLKGAVLFGVLLSILFVFSTPIIVFAGGEKYQSYGYVVKIIAVLYFFIFLSYPIRIAVRILVLNKIFFLGYLLSFVSSLLTFHFLLDYSGLTGAVIGLIMNQIIMILYWQNQLKKNHFQLWK
ncbi:hypothetical protein [Flavobacterium succinicans]|uniref:Polysaccharide biosynthesis protein n=1 Tax=Flavobacterium succinicans TaxID=29536 RepID=A0A199XRR4_9FLAO|nr:hypothetical protein [Flavobacterium succinicans]OAZ04019.1 polysaccharide biosynthesis protein [Flavobacterium succinicans]